MAVTFHPHPRTIVQPEAVPLLLTTIERRVRLLKAAGADDVDVVHFDRALSQLSPEEFVDQVLRARLGAACVVVGDNFRFGHRASGHVDTLRGLGLDVDDVPLLTDGEAVMSSTWVRGRVAAGDVVAAATGLGRPHRVEGPVVRGQARGRAMGYPTANVDVTPGMAVPADGVYAGWLVRADEQQLPAAISVGTNPTFGDNKRTVEAYVLTERLDPPPPLEIYGEPVGVEFVERLRDQQRFDAPDALVAEMARDVDRAASVLGYA